MNPEAESANNEGSNAIKQAEAAIINEQMNPVTKEGSNATREALI
jgi:hypothetical protein